MHSVQQVLNRVSQSKQTRECPRPDQRPFSGVCKHVGGFQSRWLPSPRPPPHVEHSVLLFESDSYNNK